eukprot:SAG22_NODE_2809_length_2190_cov_3.879484_4_plen_206_part_00
MLKISGQAQGTGEKVASGYRMYFHEVLTGDEVEAEFANSGGQQHAILSAWSVDCEAWTREPGVRLTGENNVIAVRNDIAASRVAPSDSHHLSQPDPLLHYLALHAVGAPGAEDLVWSPDVIPLAEGGYRMYYEGRSGDASSILSAYSEDGLVFTAEPGIRLGGGGGGGGDGGGGGNYGSPRCLHMDPADVTTRRPGFVASTPRFR